jgi:hypothetical protein
LETQEVQLEPREPVPRTLSPGRSAGRFVGAVRLPIAGPYRPLAHLYVGDDGILRWRLRLWHVDRPVVRWFSTETLRTFAETNRLREVTAAIDRLVAYAASPGAR